MHVFSFYIFSSVCFSPAGKFHTSNDPRVVILCSSFQFNARTQTSSNISIDPLYSLWDSWSIQLYREEPQLYCQYDPGPLRSLVCLLLFFFFLLPIKTLQQEPSLWLFVFFILLSPFFFSGYVPSSEGLRSKDIITVTIYDFHFPFPWLLQPTSQVWTPASSSHFRWCSRFDFLMHSKASVWMSRMRWWWDPLSAISPAPSSHLIFPPAFTGKFPCLYWKREGIRTGCRQINNLPPQLNQD